jgi:glutamate transport system permease protein
VVTLSDYVEQFVDLFNTFDVMGAFWLTIQLTVLSAVGSLVIGTVLALMRISPIPSLQWAGTTYVNLLRNTPLTVIILFCNLGLFVQLGVTLASPTSQTYFDDNNFRLAVVGLSVYHAAFVCEALRSGVNTVPVGQAEAARAIGLSFLPAARLIIFPQAFRGAIAPLGNTLIALTKNTTVASAIGVAEASTLMKTMIEFRPDVIIAIFLTFALGFVILVLPVGLLVTSLSRRLAVAR